MTHSCASVAGFFFLSFFYQATIIDCTCCLLNLLKTNQEGNALFTPRVHHITLHFLCMLKGALNKENFINRWNRKEQGEEMGKGRKSYSLSFFSFLYVLQLKPVLYN